MCSRNGSLRLGSAKNVRGTRHGGMSRSRLVGGISIGGPLRPTPPSSPPSPPLFARDFTTSSRDTKQRVRRTEEDSRLLLSVPRDLSASRESNEKEVWERFCRFRPPLPSAKTVARNSPIPRVYRVRGSKREGATRAPRYLSPSGEIRIGKRTRGGSV